MTKTKEEWKPVDGYEGYYVSNKGRVFGRSGKILKPRGKHGHYLSIHCRKDNKEKILLVHRLVAKAFIPNPENKPQVNHKNGDKTDNRVENLEWCTPWENLEHAYKNGFGGWKNLLYPKQIEEIRQRRANGESSKDLAEEFNVSPNTIRIHCKGIVPERISEEEINKIRQCYIENMPILEICQRFNRSENSIEKYCKDLHRKRIPYKVSKFTDNEILEIQNYHKQGLSYSEISRMLGVPRKTISRYCNKKLDVT